MSTTTQIAGIDNIVLIIIDQLRADYARYLPRCSEVLPYSAICDTNSIPTSTEAMHANISTGEYPSGHGLVSKVAKGRKDGLLEFSDKLRSKELSSLASLANRHGFEAYLIGGKRETVQVMGTETECSLRVN